MTEYVWYASYGSNLCEDRFLCYINGGQPEGSLDTEIGCRNNDAPRESKEVIIPFELIFAREAARWGGGGVAFIQPLTEETKDKKTLGRMYLITKEQFIDVVSQENGQIPVEINFAKVQEMKNHSFTKSWYGNIVHLGEENGFPIFTFTHDWQEQLVIKAPTTAYLKTIIRGLLETYSNDYEALATYLHSCKGVEEAYTYEQLLDLIEIAR
jgi:hypothetical protein